MAESTSGGSGIIWFVGMLTILFVGLKLTGFVNWPWGWVISPIWITFLIVVVVAALLALLNGGR